jgi:Methyltransferase domain
MTTLRHRQHQHREQERKQQSRTSSSIRTSTRILQCLLLIVGLTLIINLSREKFINNELLPAVILQQNAAETTTTPTTTTTTTTTTTSSTWKTLIKAMKPAIRAAKAKLVAGLKKEGECALETPLCHFSDLQPLPFPSNMVQRGNGESEKTMMTGMDMLNGEACIVYGVGISTDSAFEQTMATRNCQVFAFDCTITEEAASVKNMNFTFLPICIGDDTASQHIGNTWKGVNQKDTVRIFQPLAQVMSNLHHTHIDFLKFDTEGNEWTMFESILTAPFLPRQLNFEMHLEGALPASVPPIMVKGKRRFKVNEVILRFMDVGYGIVSIEPNPFDPYCADVTLVLMK